MPQITIDFSYFTNIINQILSQPTPFHAVWLLIKLGGWIPLVYLLGYAIWQIYLINIQTKWASTQKFVILAIDTPKNTEQSPKAVESIFAHFYGMKAGYNMKDKYITGKFPLGVSLEIVSHGGDVQFYIRTPLKHRDLVESAIFSQYPDAEITEVEDYAKQFPRQFPHEKYEAFGCDFELDAPDYYPIRTYPQFEHGLTGEFKDPLSLILETMAKMHSDETLCFQILITPAGDSWRKKGVKEVQKMVGQAPSEKKGLLGGITGEFIDYAISGNPPGGGKGDAGGGETPKIMTMSPGERKVIESIEMKLSKVGYPSKLRYVHFAPHETFINKYTVVKGFLKQFAVLNANSFGAVHKTMPKKNYWYHRRVRPSKQRAIMGSYIDRDGGIGGPMYILNIEELATLWHFPTIESKVPQVRKTETKKGEPPRGLPVR